VAQAYLLLITSGSVGSNRSSNQPVLGVVQHSIKLYSLLSSSNHILSYGPNSVHHVFDNELKPNLLFIPHLPSIELGFAIKRKNTYAATSASGDDGGKRWGLGFCHGSYGDSGLGL